MKRYIVFSLALFIGILFTGCSDYSSYNSVNNGIIGEWEIHEVGLKPTKRWHTYKDVTEKYNDYKYKFEATGELTVTDVSSGASYPGWWYLEETVEWDEDEGEEESQFFIHGEFYSPDGNYTRVINWKDLKVNKNRMKFKEYRNNGKYRYHMKKTSE